MDVAGRVARVREALAAHGCDALLVTGMENVRWLTAFTGSAARVVVGPDELALVTDGRYGDQAELELAGAAVEGTVLVGRSLAVQRDLLCDLVRHAPRLGLE